MRLSAVALLSLLGMGASSLGVTWLTPAPAAGEASTVASTETRSPTQSPSASAASRPVEPASVAAPADPAAFTVEGKLRLDARLGHATLPGSRSSETFVLVELGAFEATALEARAPVSLSIVIDRSGSMKGQRLTNAIAAARGMLGRLRHNDTISLIAYDDTAELLLAPTTVDRVDRLAFERMLSSLRSGGHTCISCGLDLARAQVRSRAGALSRVLLLSDGVANRGLTTVPEFRLLGDVARQERTAITSIGVDLDYDERTLFAVSQASNGHHYFVEDPTGLPAVFEREAADLVGSVADRVDVDVTLAEGVELVEVIARGHRREGDDRVALSFGSFAAGEQKSALLRVRVAPGAGSRSLADVRLRWRDLTEAGLEDEAPSKTAAGRLGLVLDPSSDRVAALDPSVEARLGRRDTLDALLGANAAFAGGDVTAARQKLEAAREQVQERLRRAAPTPGSALGTDFDRQLEALGAAEASFDEAAAAAPVTAPTTAPALPKGKKAIRKNAEIADPFG